jgi:hypothetical protein
MSTRVASPSGEYVPPTLTAEQRAAVRHVVVAALADDLAASISNIGHPVGMGIAPPREACLRAAGMIVDRISDAALGVLGTATDA